MKCLKLFFTISLKKESDLSGRIDEIRTKPMIKDMRQVDNAPKVPRAAVLWFYVHKINEK